jgi:hypothetical protein
MDRRALHGGPPTTLMAREIKRFQSDGDMFPGLRVLVESSLRSDIQPGCAVRNGHLEQSPH